MIVIGIIFIILGLVYFYRQTIVIKICQFVKQYLFNEHIVVLYGKKIGLFLFLAGTVFIGIGVQQIMHKDLLFTAYKHFYSRNFDTAERVCYNILKEEPKNVNAMLLLGKIYFVTGQYYRAKSIFTQIKNIGGKEVEKKVDTYLTVIDEKLKK